MIHLVHVSKVFGTASSGTVAALRDINLSFNGEGTIVVRGPSGSGKTTLLALLGCLSRPTAGRIWIHDTEVSGLSERRLGDLRRRYFGFVFQDFQLIHGLSALTNAMLPLYPVEPSLGKIRAKALDLLTDLGLGSRVSTRVEHLSGGEQQRVALARALVTDPGFLVADEPTAHLDRNLSQQFLSLVEGLRRRGKTVLMASHDPLVCESPVTRRVITLRDGRLDAPEETR